MECSNDLFDILDDNNDGFEHRTDQLDQYFELGHIHSTVNEEDMMEDTDDDDDNGDNTDNEVQIFV